MNTEQVFPPSKYIREGLTSRGLTQTDLAIITKRTPSEISSYLTREKISYEFAKDLALVLGHTAEYWLALENRYRLSLIDEPDAEKVKINSFMQDYPLKDMQKRGWITKTNDFTVLSKELDKFFAEGLDDEGVERAAFFKRTIKNDNLNPAEKAWLCRAVQLAKMLPHSGYDERRLPNLFNKLKKAIRSSQSASSIATLLQQYGIRFVVIEPLPRARIDGASFWLDENSPVIALTLRFDNVGSFWFALTHELMHIKHRDGTSVDDLESSPVNEIERQRNSEAADFLVPQSELEKFVRNNKPYFSQIAIVEFAKQIGVHPGIIVGQLQHRKQIGYSAHHASMAKVRDLATLTAFTDGWGNPLAKVKYEEFK